VYRVICQAVPNAEVFYYPNILVVINGNHYVISLYAESIYNTMHHYC